MVNTQNVPDDAPIISEAPLVSPLKGDGNRDVVALAVVGLFLLIAFSIVAAEEVIQRQRETD